MCQECCNCEEIIELEKIKYEFTYENPYGEVSHLCKETLIFPDEAELDKLVEEFTKFLNVLGYDVDRLEVIEKED